MFKTKGNKPKILAKTKNNSTLKAFGIFIISFILLFAGYSENYWKVADQKWYSRFQTDSEALIVGRLAKSKQDGIFSSGALPGYGNSTEQPVNYFDRPFKFQYMAYFNAIDFKSYTTYNSQICGQGILFGLLSKINHKPAFKELFGYRKFNAALLAIVISLLVLWFFSGIGMDDSLNGFTCWNIFTMAYCFCSKPMVVNMGVLCSDTCGDVLYEKESRDYTKA